MTSRSLGPTTPPHELDRLARLVQSVGHVSVRVANWAGDVEVMLDDRNPRHATVYLREGADPTGLGEVVGAALDEIEATDRARRRQGIECVPELEEPAERERRPPDASATGRPIPAPRLRLVEEN